MTKEKILKDIKVSMQVTRWSAYRRLILAKELSNYFFINLNSTYPKFIIRKFLNKNCKVNSFLYLEILNRLNRFSFSDKLKDKIDRFIKKTFDQHVAYDDFISDIYIGQSNTSFLNILKTRDISKPFILERGSTHYSHQMKNLYKNNFHNNNLISIESWKSELAEYSIADYISVPSTFSAETFIKNGISRKKILINPYGVDLDLFTPKRSINTQNTSAKKDSKMRILYVGSGSYRKGYDRLCKISDLVKDFAKIFHVGSILDFTKESNIAHNSKIINIGVVKQEKLPNFYKDADVFIFPTREDGFGLVLTQAAAAGIPILSTSKCGIYDVIPKETYDECIVECEEEDMVIEMFKEKLLYLHLNPDVRIKRGILNNKFAKDNHSWEQYGLRYKENISKILGIYS